MESAGPERMSIMPASIRRESELPEKPIRELVERVEEVVTRMKRPG